MARVKIPSDLKGLTFGDVQGLIEIREDNHEQIVHAMNTAIAAGLEEIGLAAERFAKRLCPVDTGRLRNSITHALNSDAKEVYIGTNIPYATYIEFGVSTWNGQGPKKAPKGGYQMLRKAATEHGQFYGNIMKKHLENG